MSIGYACITIGISGTDLSRCILKNATPENIQRIIKTNLNALESMIDYNHHNNIRLFRISSDIIPFASHPVNQVAWWDIFKEDLYRIGEKIKSYRIRVSMHPGQYTVLNSMNDSVVYQALQELEYHSRFLDALGTDQTSKLILHIGGIYGDKQNAMKSFIQNYLLLPHSVKLRLVIENDDKNYTIQDVLTISSETGAPVVFDNLHHQINPPELLRSESEWINECEKTWSAKDGIQKVHYSMQKSGGQSGSHSDTIHTTQFLDFYKNLPNKDIDIMLEVKDKNLSAIKCILITENDVSYETLKAEWERYRYYVYSHSILLYQELDKMFLQRNTLSAIDFYESLEQIYFIPSDTAAEISAATLIWESYFEENCSITNRNRFIKLINEYRAGKGTLKSLKNHLLKCANIVNDELLISSLYFYL
jgi:UV DNA damage endonuclease